jgi:L-gulonate 3-dehydrogenase
VAIVCCVGVGTIGRSWAAAFARAGHEVRLYDSGPNAAKLSKSRLLAECGHSPSHGMSREQIEQLLQSCGTLGEALRDVEYVQESIAEDASLKRELFMQIGELVSSECTLASSTSEIPLSRFSFDVPCRAQMVVAHPINPPHLIPVVEISGSSWTNPQTIDKCMTFQRSIGQEPILLHGEMEGYVVNRLQFALIGEALKLVSSGYCSVVDVDKAIKDGLGRRWAFMGPFETGHLNADGGFYEYISKFRPIIERLLSNVSPGAPLDDQLVRFIHDQLLHVIPLENIRARQAWRDLQLLNCRIR